MVTAYAVLGGTPAYLRQFDDRYRLLENIRSRILTLQTCLYDEPRFLLLQEVRQPRSYFAISEAMARGNTRPNETAQAAGLGDDGSGSRFRVRHHQVNLDLGPQSSRNPLYERQRGFDRGVL